jgi:hypothetical protein
VKILPKRKQVLGRVAVFSKTEGNIKLVGAEKGSTVFVVIDDVGRDVTEYSRGDIVVPHKFNHIFLPDGRERRAILHEDEILAAVTEVSLDQLTIEGAPRAVEQAAEAAS